MSRDVNLLCGTDAFMAEDNADTDYRPVQCPECGCGFLHLVMAYLDFGQAVKVGDGPIVISSGETSGYGPLVAMKFWGECGHTVYRKYQFHKGQTLVEVRAVPGEDGNCLTGEL